MKAKEEWIKATLDSIENMQPAELSPQLSNKILNNTAALKGKIIPMRPMAKWAAAASIILLAGLNLISILQYSKTSHSNQSETNPVYKEYFSYLNTLN